MSIESVMPSNNFILAVPFSSCLQSLPVSGSFQMTLKSQLFTSGGQSIEVSASASVLPMNQSFSISPSTSGLISFGINWLDLVAVQGTLKSPLQHHSSKASIVRHSALFYCPALTSIHDYWKNHSFDYTNFCWQSNVSAFLICCLDGS